MCLQSRWHRVEVHRADRMNLAFAIVDPARPGPAWDQ
jgi:hypothetical protein